MSKIGIGSAQFGLNYGINSKKKINTLQIKKIFNYLYNNKKKCYIETAPVYGNAESLIGKNLKKKNQFKIITKTISSNGKKIDQQFIKKMNYNFLLSLKRLKQKKIYSIMVHDVNDLFKKNSNLLYDYLLNLKKKKLVKKIGVSVYNKKDINKILLKYKFDIYQLPCNIFDQRLIYDGTLDKLKRKNIELHARSIFLQGMLFKKINEIPKNFISLKKKINLFHSRINYSKITSQEAAISFVSNLKKFETLIIGFDNFEQFKNIIKNPIRKLHFKTTDLYCRDKKSMDPRRWKKI
ncbi:aldo/keto reductase [Candidatus Pelagibacter ubique]|nr:aldo/keto reductase [Candidatus Pelagibacter ubique]